MRTNGTVIRGLEIPTPFEIWKRLKDWMETALTSEKKGEVALMVGTLLLMGYVTFVLHQGLENAAIAPF